MWWLLNVLCVLGIAVVSLSILGWWKDRHFRKNGVKNPSVKVKMLGNMLDTFLKKMHFKDILLKHYEEFSDERYFGFLQFLTPVVILRDIEVIKQVAIKDFDYFTDHVLTLNENGDPLFGNNLLSLRGQKWRDMRATLSPAFTSSKMRGMFQFIVDCGEQMADYYIKEMDKENNKVRGLLEIEMKDAFTRYANDVIASSAFGLSVNSFTERENEFYMMGKESTKFSGLQFFKYLLIMSYPRLFKLLGIHFMSKKLVDFYRTLVWNTIKDREERDIVRNDMIQLLMEAKKGTLSHDSQEDDKDAGFATVEEFSIGKKSVKRDWSNDEIVAQAFIFFGAGFDTSSNLLCFLSHELALHPEVQRRLQEEIDEVEASIDGKLTYDCLHNMKYMDMVVSETMRMWPPTMITDRRCAKQYTLPPPNSKTSKGYQVNPGDGVWIPIYAIHRSPEFYKNPDVFDPERFSDENKLNIKPFTYLPFGIGPRNCIGSRFALMEIKAIIYNLLLKFDIVTTAKTQNPIQLKVDALTFQSEKGFWVGLKPRLKSTNSST